MAPVGPQGSGGRWSRSRGSNGASVARRTSRKLPVGSGTGGGACDDDEGRQRSVMCKVKATPAEEARVVRHSRRREAPTLEVLQRGFHGRCVSSAVIE